MTADLKNDFAFKGLEYGPDVQVQKVLHQRK